ncbi:MAG: LuxR C-terminal-related transcriptional regulator [Urechidicola sp.]|nr:LuxR C-terminal-related transcriptional regulator [Urechidicola sp.]
MPNRLPHFLFFVFCSLLSLQAQFEFRGQVNSEFIKSTVYLTEVDDYKKTALFITDNILQSTTTDSLGYYSFSGDFLSSTNKIYKIYVDNCNEDITDYNHLISTCDDSNSVLFIANNSDEIYFPLNSMEQMFCSIEISRLQNIAIFKIDSLQEDLLNNIQYSISKKQRSILFNKYFKNLQEYSKTFKEPLAELYTYQLYTNNESFTRKFYLDDLKKSDYYNQLLEHLKTEYPNSTYAYQFEDDLQHDTIGTKNKSTENTIILLAILLSASLIINFILIKRKHKKVSTINYTHVLSKQEQKVFELMNSELSNKQIAEKLFISISTVKTHINNIYSKLSISSRKEVSNFF